MHIFMIHDKTGFIKQITMTNNKKLPVIPTELTIATINFYNKELVGCYYNNGAFYEDEEKTKEISDPIGYNKPESEPEPVEETYTLDEAAAIIADEVANNE